MLMEHTIQTLKALRLPGMVTAFEEQQISAAAHGKPNSPHIIGLPRGSVRNGVSASG